MTDEDYAALQRLAQSAKALTESEAWGVVQAELKAEISAEWAQTTWDAPATREQRFAELKGLEMLQLRLQAWIGNAKYEAAARDKRRRRAD